MYVLNWPRTESFFDRDLAGLKLKSIFVFDDLLYRSKTFLVEWLYLTDQDCLTLVFGLLSGMGAMGLELSALTNIEHLQRLCSSFSDMYEVTMAILNLVEGEILVAADWKQACTQFRRVNAITAAPVMKAIRHWQAALKLVRNIMCTAVKMVLSMLLCPSRLRANLFTGQFFFDPPDHQEFRRQSREVGFDEALYLRAIDDVPISQKRKSGS